LAEFLKASLEKYVKNLGVSIKIIRMEQRSGLIRARLRGAAASRGQVITFLDAHCECTLGWLEPLLARIKEDRYGGSERGPASRLSLGFTALLKNRTEHSSLM